MGFFLVMEECTFRAAHKIRLPDGSWEPLHEHDWLLRIFVKTQQLDHNQLVVDFLDLQAHLQAVLAPYLNQNINDLPPFCDGISPTTEYLAWSFFEALAPRLDDERVSLCRVELREAPTSWGIYVRD